MIVGLILMVMTMTTTFNVNIRDNFKTSTRPNGVSARQFILEKINHYDKINLDFRGENPTPSFVDECIGQLISDIGWEKFKAIVQISNPTESARSLIKHVISRRKMQNPA